MPSLGSLLTFGWFAFTAYCIPHPGHPAHLPTLPESSLPSPTNLTLRIIALGVGHQNYTCNSTSGTYGSNVALADLYDATQYLSQRPNSVQTLSQERLKQFEEAGECAGESDYHPWLHSIGEHYFENSTPPSPDFDLYELDLFLGAKKVINVAAPDSANTDWLYLTDNGKGKTHGLKAVYRVETAGGKPPTSCAGDAQIYVPYVAQYWFYD